MKQDKELLLKDLCSRLPYGVKVNEDIQGDATLIGLTTERALTTCEVEGKFNNFPIELIKPYLFPLSSITEEQKRELSDLLSQEAKIFIEQLKNDDGGIDEGKYRFINGLELDWLLKNHFDFRGLIPKGLANDATGLNIY